MSRLLQPWPVQQKAKDANRSFKRRAVQDTSGRLAVFEHVVEYGNDRFVTDIRVKPGQPAQHLREVGWLVLPKQILK